MIGLNVQLSANDSNNQDIEQDSISIQNLIRESLNQKLDSKRKQKTRDEMHETLIAAIQEFARCFMIVGFDLENDPIVLSRAMSPMEGEALVSLTKKVYADISKR